MSPMTGPWHHPRIVQGGSSTPCGQTPDDVSKAKTPDDGRTARLGGIVARGRPIGAARDFIRGTAHAGLAVVGDLARHLDLVSLIDGELASEQRARAAKTRRPGVSAGELVVSLAECQLVGGALFDHLEDLRVDSAVAGGRARCRRRRQRCRSASAFAVHCQHVERAMSRAGRRLNRALGRDAGEAVTIDLDATQITVYGRAKDGTASGPGAIPDQVRTVFAGRPLRTLPVPPGGEWPRS